MADDRYHIEIKALGRNIRTYRKERGMTQLDLETSTGIDRTNLSKIENGLLDIQFSSIVRIAEALNVSTTDLLKAVKIED